MNATEQRLIDRASSMEKMSRTKGWKIYCEEVDDAIMKRFLLAERLAGKDRAQEVEANLLEARGLRIAGQIFANKIEEANKIKELLRETNE